MSFRKHYLSRAQTRALSGEMPIGDPYGGAAYGEKNAPVVAVVATGWAASAATGIAAGLLWASTALQAAALVTKDKNLAKWGKYTAIAGGVAAMAQGMTAGTGAEQASNTSTMAGTDQLTTTQTSGLADQTIAANAGQSTAGSAVADTLAQASPSATTSGLSIAGGGDGGLIASKMTDGLRVGGVGGEAMVGGAGAGSGGSGFMEWMKANPQQAMVAGQGVSGAAQGYLQSRAMDKQTKEAQRAEEAKRAEDEAARQRLNQGILGTSVPLNVRFDPRALFAVPAQQPVRFAASPYLQPNGLIARRMV